MDQYEIRESLRAILFAIVEAGDTARCGALDAAPGCYAIRMSDEAILKRVDEIVHLTQDPGRHQFPGSFS